MCGIMCYCGKKQAIPILIDGLRRLEYRGYDSAGFAVVTNSGPPKNGKNSRNGRNGNNKRNIKKMLFKAPIKGHYPIFYEFFLRFLLPELHQF